MLNIGEHVLRAVGQQRPQPKCCAAAALLPKAPATLMFPPGHESNNTFQTLHNCLTRCVCVSRVRQLEDGAPFLNDLPPHDALRIGFLQLVKGICFSHQLLAPNPCNGSRPTALMHTCTVSLQAEHKLPQKEHFVHDFAINPLGGHVALGVC